VLRKGADGLSELASSPFQQTKTKLLRGARRFSLVRSATHHERSSMADWFKINSSNLWSLATFLAASIVVFIASRGTEFQPFGIGLLAASVALLLTMGIFEAICLIVTSWFRSFDEEDSHSHSAE
jgi:hypothetical protein